MTDKRVALTIEGRQEEVGPANHRSLVLVHPPQQGLLEGFSSGLVALANHVNSELPGVRVKLLDLGLAKPDEICREVKRCESSAESPLFVGLATTTASYQSALHVARVFKALSPNCIVVMGGHHATTQDDVVLGNKEVDLVIRGEGEIALVELLRHYPRLTFVPNLSFMRGLEVVRNHAAPLLERKDLDRIPVAFRGWGLRSAPGKFHHTTYVSARGCPHKCHFCAVANERIRHKSIEAVIRDLRLLVGEMGYKSIAIEDNFFAHSPERTIELCKAIEELQKELPFGWDCQTRVESCRREDVMTAMERAGCEAVYLGVESFDPEHLIYLGKTREPGGYLRLLLEKIVPWLVQSTIDCYINIQLGLPGEGPSHRSNTLRLLAEIGRIAEAQDTVITIFPQLHVVYPGTGHFHQALAEGRYGPDGKNVFERFTAWEAQRQPILRWLGEHFAHGTGGIPEGILNADFLRSGRFVENSDAIFEVINYLNDMAATPGICVFRYGRYLATSHETGAVEFADEVAG